MLFVVPTFITTLIPEKAYAQGAPVIDAFNGIFNIGSWTENITTAGASVSTAGATAASAASDAVTAVQTSLTAVATQWWYYVKELSLDAVAQALKKMLVIKMTSMMMNYVANGFNGGPAFITNQGQYYYGVNNEVTQRYLYELDYLRSMTDPASLTYRILDDSQRRLEQQAYQNYDEALQPLPGDDFPGGQQGYEEYVNGGQCPTGNNIDCWMAMQDPANDPWEVLSAQNRELVKRRNEALTHAQGEILAANGFATAKICLESFVRNNSQYCSQYLSQIPGRIILEQLAKYQASALEELHNSRTINDFVASALIDLGTEWMTKGSMR